MKPERRDSQEATTQTESLETVSVVVDGPQRPLRWFRKPCPQCIATGNGRVLEHYPLMRTTRAEVVVCACGCVYAREVATEVHE